jgi:dolichol-phosphate mannosyltransferase
MLLTLVIPVYNEADNIEFVVNEWNEMLLKTIEGQDYVILAMDDGSKDATPQVLEKMLTTFPRLKVHRHTNRGHGQTCLEGYRMAAKMGSEWVMQIDSDGQCDPVFFPELWRGRSQYPIQYGRRYQRLDGLARKVVSLVLRWFLYLVMGTRLHDTNVPYRLYPAKLAAETADRIPKAFDLANIAMALLLEPKGFHEIPIHFRDRRGGAASVKWWGFAKKAYLLYKDLQLLKGV